MNIEFRDSLAGIEEYVPSKSIEEVVKEYNLDADKVVKLSSNENPLGISPKAIKKITEHMNESHIYPEVCSPDLRCAISEYVGYPIDSIVIGTGTDGVLDTITRLFVDKNDETVIPIPTFSFYELITRICGGTPRFIARKRDFTIPLEKLMDSVTTRTKIIFFCSPNNPSGNTMREEDVRMIAESVDCIVVIDEAYVEFADSSLTHLVNEYENLVVTRTFSKAFGLAGLRIGYAILPNWISEGYMRVSQPFSVNRIGIVTGIAALQDMEHLNRTVKLVKDGRRIFRSHIPFKTFPSEANFVLVDVSPFESRDVCEALLRMGIIVRDCSSFRGCSNSHIRISVGTEEQNMKVVDALNKIKQSGLDDTR
jgi:histidinol-phosphate aminotransferase